MAVKEFLALTMPTKVSFALMILVPYFYVGDAVAQTIDLSTDSAEVSPESRQFPSTSLPQSREDNYSRYILGPGDEVSLSVVGLPEFSQPQVILPDGTIAVPLLGSVSANGKTLQELETSITRRLSFYLIEPSVTLSLLSLRPVSVVVAGEVNRPGPIQLESLTASSGANAPTLTAALATAGGIRRTADLRNVTVQRRLPDGDQTTFTVDLWESIFQGSQSEDVILRDGDTIFISRISEGSNVDSQLVAQSSLAPEVIGVSVIGEVESPGEVQISPNSTAINALAVAGGHNNDANLTTVGLLRLNDNGQLERLELDLSDSTDSTPVRDGDVIVVPAKGYLNFVDSIARTLQPITAPFNFLLLIDSVLGR